VAIDLADRLDAATGILRHQLDVGTTGQIPRDRGVAKGVRRYLLPFVISGKASGLYGAIPSFPDAAYRPSMMFNDGMVADAEPVPSAKVGEETRGERNGRLSL
jgi:hypothetical protein